MSMSENPATGSFSWYGQYWLDGNRPKEILSVTYEFSLLQWIFTVKWKKGQSKKELLESGYAEDKFKSLTASFGMGKNSQKKQT